MRVWIHSLRNAVAMTGFSRIQMCYTVLRAMRPVSPALVGIQRVAYPVQKTPIYLAHHVHAQIVISWMNLFKDAQLVRLIVLIVGQDIALNVFMGVDLMMIIFVYCRMDMAGLNLGIMQIDAIIIANTVQFSPSKHG
jgi:hypothetical protein